MSAYVCITCGTQYPPSPEPPAHCPICEDERQYVGHSGQEWIPFEKLQQEFRNSFFQEGPGICGIVTEPKFAIGQRALLLRTSQQNILWDCVSLVNEDTVERVRSLGGIDAIAISHPHYYSSMIEWSRAVGNIPIYLHADDRQWVQRPDPAIQFWSGETHSLGAGITLIRVGAHFPGFQALHWAGAEGGDGALFTGDMPQVCADRRYVSFMYSYPNWIPVDAAAVRRVYHALDQYRFSKLHGAFPGFTVQGNAKQALRLSAERYLRAIGDHEPL